MAKQYNFRDIRALLIEGFTDEELRYLCFDVPAFRSVFFQLAKGTSKSEIVQQLLEYVEQKELIETLLSQVKERNPAKYNTIFSGIHGKFQKAISVCLKRFLFTTLLGVFAVMGLWLSLQALVQGWQVTPPFETIAFASTGIDRSRLNDPDNDNDNDDDDGEDDDDDDNDDDDDGDDEDDCDSLDRGTTTESGSTGKLKADLEVIKTVDNPTPGEEDTIVYTILLTNLGPDDAPSVRLKDVLPLGVTYVGNTSSQGTYDNSKSRWTVGDLKRSNNATLNITVTVDSGTTGRTITNTASSQGCEPPDPNHNNNIGEAVITVKSVLTGADLELNKTVNVTNPNAGDTIIYTVMITNKGPEGATGVRITDKVPLGLAFVPPYTASRGSYDSGSGQWNIGDLANDSDGTLNITAKVNNCTNGQTIINTTKILTPNQPDPNLSNNEAHAGITVTSVTPCYVYLPIIFKNYPPPSCYIETFDDPDSPWHFDISLEPPTILRYFEGKYYVFAQNKRGIHWAISPRGPYYNYSVQVDVRWANTNKNVAEEYGIIFDKSNDITMYRFNINTHTSTYTLGKLQSTWISLFSDTSSDILTGTSTNTLKVERNSYNITMYINGKYQKSYPDYNPLPRGFTGVNIFRDNVNGEVYFDNFIICSHELSTVNVNNFETNLASGIASGP